MTGTTQALSERLRTQRIIRWIQFADKRLRHRFPFLKHQDAIGMSITIGSAAGILIFSALYIANLIPAWACIVCNAILASFLHEMEHDLIHNLYFKDSKRTQNFLFWIVWLFRFNTINPWFRKAIHLIHHKNSGQPDDIEERFIGNGMPFGFRRWLTMTDLAMALVFQGRRIQRDAVREFKKITVPARIGPYREIYQLLWYAYLIAGLFSLICWFAGIPVHLSGRAGLALDCLNAFGVIYMVPAWIRQTSIQIVSSNMHYYGDVDSLFKQTQVLDSWLVLPLHLFCFNFGATHGIHHFVVNQPFYIRQATAPFVRPALKKYGIRFNDFRSMLRANRYAETA